MEELFIRIFGNYTMIDLISYAWFMLIGYTINALVETTGRDIESPKTPRKWSWRFWRKDNWRRYIVTLLSTYTLFRFYTEFSGGVFTDFDALMIGLLGDGIAATAKKRIDMVSANRRKLVEQEKIREEKYNKPMV